VEGQVRTVDLRSHAALTEVAVTAGAGMVTFAGLVDASP
jgi:hypothetical protein